MAEKIKAEGKKGKMKLMLAIDENPWSYNALIWVLDNLKDTICSSSTGKSLVLFSPQPLPAPSFYSSAPFVPSRFYFHGPSASEVNRPAQEHGRKVALGLLEKAKGICACRGVTVETVIEVGDPKEAICNAVQKYEIDLLIVGCEDYGFLKRIFTESASEYCLKNAKCSVLLVKNSK